MKGRAMSRPVSIRRSLLADLVVVVVVLAAAITAVTALGTRRALRMLSESIIGRTLEQTEAMLRGFFGPVESSLGLVRRWGEAGLLGAGAGDATERLVGPVLREHPQISAFIVADGRGQERMLRREGDHWIVRETRVEEWMGRSRIREWTDDSPQPAESWQELGYDPRVRPWFRGAADQGAPDPLGGPAAPFWTEPYWFFSAQAPGMTIAARFESPLPGADAVNVVGLDVLLSDVTAFTATLRPSPRGQTFVMTGDSRLVGLPAGDSDGRESAEALLRRPAESGLRVAAAGADAFFRTAPSRRGAFRFEVDGERWWAGVRTLRLGSDRDLISAVAVPEADLLGELRLLSVWIVLIAAAVGAAGLWRAVTLARHFSRPIEELVHESERISRGDLDAGPALTSGIREVRRLAEAHERMRVGLVSLMRLERDLQLARQIQQRTFPQRLPQVAGFAIAGWIEPAEETGGDTYDVIELTEGRRASAPEIASHRAGRAVALLADATGHGIGPALSVTQVRAMLRMALRMQEGLEVIAFQLNQQLHADLPEGRFITAWIGELDG
jgi:hypothetical protein